MRLDYLLKQLKSIKNKDGIFAPNLTPALEKEILKHLYIAQDFIDQRLNISTEDLGKYV